MPLIFLLLINAAFAQEAETCNIEYYLRNTNEYKSYVLSKKELGLDRDYNMQSLFPEMSLGVNQSSNNNKSFKSVSKSSLSLGLSQQIYNGDLYSKKDKNIDIIEKYQSTIMNENRNKLILSLFNSVSEYKYKQDVLSIYEDRLKRQLADVKKIKFDISLGDAATVDLRMANLRVKNLELDILKIKTELADSADRIQKKYGLSPREIKNITSQSVMSCKSIGFKNALITKRRLQLQQAESNKEIRDASLLPSLSLSLSMTPPGSGNFNNISYKKVNYSASINISLPLSSLFLQQNSEKQMSIEVNRINLESEESLKDNEIERKNINDTITILGKTIEYEKKALSVEKEKLSYISSRLKSGKDSIISYYQQLEVIDTLEISLKKEENDLEYKKIELFFID